MQIVCARLFFRLDYFYLVKLILTQNFLMKTFYYGVTKIVFLLLYLNQMSNEVHGL